LNAALRWRNPQPAAPGWQPIEAQIQDWPGSDTPLYLEFRRLSDGAAPTVLTLDNIRLTTACR
jgi:hypothetical protein